MLLVYIFYISVEPSYGSVNASINEIFDNEWFQDAFQLLLFRQ